MFLNKYETFEEGIRKAEYVKITDPRLKTHYVTLVKYFKSTDVSDKVLTSKSLNISQISNKVKGFRKNHKNFEQFLFQLKTIKGKYYLKTYNNKFLNLKYENVKKSYDNNMNDERYKTSEVTTDIPKQHLEIEEITPKPEVGYKYKINNNDYFIEIYKHNENDLVELGLEFPTDMKAIANEDIVDKTNVDEKLEEYSIDEKLDEDSIDEKVDEVSIDENSDKDETTNEEDLIKVAELL